MRRSLILVVVAALVSLMTGGAKLFAQAMPRVSNETTTYEYYIQQDVQEGSNYVTNQLRDDHIVAYGTSGDYLRVKFVAVEGSTEWKIVPLNVEGMGIIAISGNGDGAAATYYADEAAADAAGATLKTWMVTSSTLCASGSQMGWNRYASGGLVKLYGWNDNGTQWRFIPANDAALAASGAGYASPLTGTKTAAEYNEWYNALSEAPAAGAISLPGGYYYVRNAEKATFHAYVYNDGGNTRAQVPNTSELSKNNYVWKVTHTAGETAVGFVNGIGNGIWNNKSQMTLGVSDFWKYGIVYFTEGMHFSNQSHLTVAGNATNNSPAATQSNPFIPTGWAHKDSRGSSYYLEPVDMSLFDVYTVSVVDGESTSTVTRTASGETATNGGFFLVAKGVVPAAGDFTASVVADKPSNIVVAEAAKTITVTYTATTASAKRELQEAIDAETDYLNVCLKYYGFKETHYAIEYYKNEIDRIQGLADAEDATMTTLEAAQVELPTIRTAAVEKMMSYGELLTKLGGFQLLWAEKVNAEAGVITDAATQLSTNAQQTDEGPIANLIDGNINTYFHSCWGNGPAEDHYITVKSTDALGDFYFFMHKRMNNDNNRPTTIKVSGRTGDEGDFTDITTISAGLPTIAQWPNYFSNIINGAGYNQIRFTVTETNNGAENNGHKFFTASEFYIIKASTVDGSVAKEVADAVAAVRNAVTEEDVMAASELIEATYDKYVYTDAAAAEALAEANAVIVKTGVGYPKSDDATRTALAAAITADKAVLGNKAYIQALEEALSAYETSTNIEMPENGKAYVIVNVPKAGTPKRYINSNASSLVALPEDINDVPASGIFVARELASGDYVFVNNEGKYLKRNGAGTSYETDANGSWNDITIGRLTKSKVIGNTAENNGYVSATSNADLFGLCYVRVRRHDNGGDACVIVRSENGNYDNSDEPYYNDTYSSGFQFVEVEYPNTPELQAAAGLEDITALATFSAPFATVIPEGVTAYYAKAQGENYVALEAIEAVAIPANEGVILTGAAGKVTMLPATTEVAAEITDNKFANTAGAAADLTTSDYILTNATPAGEAAAVTGLFKLTEAGSLAMNKAYLAGGVASAVKLLFGGNATGIEGVEAADADNAPVYDLSGRKVASPVKGGVYIKNGKKYIVK